MSTGVVRLTGTFGATGQSSSAVVFGMFNVQIWGTPLSSGLSGAFTGTVAVERSLDDGTTWVPVATDGTGTAASYTAVMSVTGMEIEQGVLYRFNCTAWTSGTINYRLSLVGNFAGASPTFRSV